MSLQNGSFVYHVPGLLVPKDLPDAKFESLLKGIDYLSKSVAQVVDSIHMYLSSGKMPELVAEMESLAEVLLAVYARKLYTTAKNIQRTASTPYRDMLQKLTDLFCSELLELVIDIQKFDAIWSGSQQIAPSEQLSIENSVELISNFTAVKYFIENFEFDQAIALLRDIVDSSVKGQTIVIINHLKNFDEKKALEVTLKVLDEHTSKVYSFNDSHKKAKILCVDDRPEILQALNQSLKEHFQPLCVSSGAAALSALQKHDIDMFILDIEMPNMDGFELAQQIRALPKYAKKPVMFLTSNSGKEYVVKALKLGAVDFVVKPVIASSLQAKIKKYLQV